jgi:hypothetical protein
MQGKACITGAAALDAVEGRRDAATEWAGACVHSGAGAGAVTRLQAIMLRDLRCCRNATYATLGLQTAALAASLAMHAADRAALRLYLQRATARISSMHLLSRPPSAATRSPCNTDLDPFG